MPMKILFAALAFASFVGFVEAEEPETVKVRDLELKVPESWKKTEPASQLRLAQFEIPKAKGDTEESQLAIFSFPGGGGGVAGNLPRWLGEFKSTGREVTLKKGKSEQGEYVIADIKGEHIGTSFRRRPKPLEDGRLLGAIVTIEGKGIYFLKMVGQNATIEEAAKDFRSAIGADAKKETDYEPSM